MKSENLPISISPDVLKSELEESSSRYHVFAGWIGVVFDPLFAVTDFFNIRQHWLELLGVRLSIAFIILIAIGLRKKIGFPAFYLGLLAISLISLQNAFTFSLIGNELLTGHCLNYMVLFLGGGMFLFWPSKYSILIVAVSAFATAWFVIGNPNIDPQVFWVKGGLLLLAMGLFMIVLIKVRYDLTLKEIKSRLALKITNEELAIQKRVVDEKNENITASINYAQRIQQSVLGSPNRLQPWFSGSFCLFQSRDVLSGDFYWFYENREEDVKIIIVADCTGHGVPAALMTMLGSSILNEIIIQRKIYEPDQILKGLDIRLIESLHKTDSGDEMNDGMAISILTFLGNRVLFSASGSSMYMIRNGELNSKKGSRFHIGNEQYKNEKVFELYEAELRKGDKFYLFSDGFQDQFGGENDRKYSTVRFREFLLKTCHLPMASQKEELDQELNSWKRSGRQTDDILVIGVEI